MEINQTVTDMMSYINETLENQINSSLNCSFVFNSTNILIEPVESRIKNVFFCSYFKNRMKLHFVGQSITM
jgi:hypothetical protein